MQALVYFFTSLPDLQPDPSGLPGSAALEKFIQGMMFDCLLLSVAVIVAGGVSWAWGHMSGNYHGVSRGKMAVLCGFLAAIITGASVSLVNTLWTAGHAA